MVQSAIADTIGVPLEDVFSLSRYLINGVQVKLKFFQSKNPFRLIAQSTTEKYKLIITDVVFKACKVTLEPGMLSAHGESIKETPAIYPFIKSEVKSFAIASGTFTINLDDVFQGNVPSRLVCGLVKGEAYSGSYQTNPFNFKNCNIESFTVYADGRALPGGGLKQNFSQDNYIEAFHSLFLGLGLDKEDDGVYCKRNEYKDGYTLFVFDLDSQVVTPGDQPALKKGNLSLEIRMSQALPWATTLICYGSFPAQFLIDEARAITL